MSILSKVKPSAKKKSTVYKKGFLSRTKAYPKGRYGLEVECEGPVLLAGSIIPKQWDGHNDGSLRGNNMEYVLNTPLDYPEAMKAVQDLFEASEKVKAVINDSNRTSFHVHLNLRDVPIVQLANIIVLYGIFENLLVNWCGEYRVGNLFAQRFCDVKWAIGAIARCLQTNSFGGTFGNDQRYMALNLASIGKFGSLEFRSMRGLTRSKEGVQWLSMINKIFEASKRYTDPTEIIAEFSGQEREMLHRVFGPDLSSELTVAFERAGEAVMPSLWDGVRQMQEVAYCLDWANVRKELAEPYVPSPFEKPERDDFDPIQEQLERVRQAVRPVRINRNNPPPVPPRGIEEVNIREWGQILENEREANGN